MIIVYSTKRTTHGGVAEREYTFGRIAMGKKVYNINGKMFIIDDESGEIKTIHIQNDPVSPDDLKEIIKILSKNQKEEKD